MVYHRYLKDPDSVDDGTTNSTSSNESGSSNAAKGLWLKFPFLACLMTSVAVLCLVHTANRQGFQRDFEVTSRKIADAFLFEASIKLNVAHDASVAASRIAAQKPKKWKKLGLDSALVYTPNEEALDHFQQQTKAMNEHGQIDKVVWHPPSARWPSIRNRLADRKRNSRKDAQNTLTCETERSCMQNTVRDQAVEITEETLAPITSEAFVGSGEAPELIKTALFYPIIKPNKADAAQKDQAIGVVSSEFLWRDFFSPATFQPRDDGLYIIVENTCGQAFTFRVRDQRLTFVGEGVACDEEFQEMKLVSDWADFVKPGASKIKHSTEVWVCGCEYRIQVVPSSDTVILYTSSWPRLVLMGSTLAFLTLFLCILAYDIYVSRRYSHVSQDLCRFNSVVESLFPEVVLDRVVDESLGLQDGITKALQGGTATTYNASDYTQSNRFLADYKVPIDVIDTVTDKPIYNSFPHTTIGFLDVAGFTSWCSERDPDQVFLLLESLYQRLDTIAKRLEVYKIETIGDCYVAVTGVPHHQDDHCILMCRFTYEAMVSFVHLTKSLEVALGPGTADLSLRVGIHSGPVIAGVLRSDKCRFQLFGDTMNTASRMESTGSPGKIQLSEDSALLLQAARKGSWLEQREDVVPVKGKGSMTTYWLKMTEHGTTLPNTFAEAGVWGEDVKKDSDESGMQDSELNKRDRLIDWCTDVLLDELRKVVARRKAMEKKQVVQGSEKRRNTRNDSETRQRRRNSHNVEYQRFLASRCLVDHVSEAIPFASYEDGLNEEDPSKVQLTPEVEGQMKAYVAEIASLYNDVPFHNLEHAAHVLMSAKKLLAKIIAPQQGGFQSTKRNSSLAFHDSTFGISSDPLMHFAMLQAAFIHDVGHLGVSNAQLAKSNKDLAARYNGKSIAEQHSLYLSMFVFADDKYAELRDLLLGDNAKDAERYYQFLLSSVLATDLADKELKQAREKRWEGAFFNDIEQDRKKMYLDAFYLSELTRVDFHIKMLAGLVALAWAALVATSYWAVPEANIEPLTGVEQKAAGVAFALLLISFLYKLCPHLLRLFDYDSEPLSGVVVGVITIETIALITNMLMAFGYPTPVVIDPVLGTRVHLLRWCEWAPLTFYIYFIVDGVDVPDKQVGLESKYFFAGCQGVSAFAGYLFPFAPNVYVWGCFLCFAVVLFLSLYKHISYKRKMFSRLERGISADDKEIYDRAYHSLRFLEDIGIVWGALVCVFFFEGFGPKMTSLLYFTRMDGFNMIWTSLIDMVSKMQNMNHIMDIYTLVFDTKERAKRQKEESIRLQHESHKKGTALCESIIQVADVAHCMQHWNVYRKWNKNLFKEMLAAFLGGKSDQDPRPGWFKGELWFFDNYVIPLATKLNESGCFGVSGVSYLRSATENRSEWKLKGEEITAQMIAEVEAELAADNLGCREVEIGTQATSGSSDSDLDRSLLGARSNSDSHSRNNNSGDETERGEEQESDQERRPSSLQQALRGDRVQRTRPTGPHRTILG